MISADDARYQQKINKCCNEVDEQIGQSLVLGGDGTTIKLGYEYCDVVYVVIGMYKQAGYKILDGPTDILNMDIDGRTKIITFQISWNV